MNAETRLKPDDWIEKDDAAWEEFKRRMDSQPFLSFYPRANDLRVGPYRGFAISMALWVRYVLFTLPLDLVTAVWTGLKGTGMGIGALAMGLASLIVTPVMVIFHRVLLTIGAVGGRLYVVPHNTSIADHLNHRLNTIKSDMEREGYDLDKFFHEVDADEISDETREHLLRRWDQ